MLMRLDQFGDSIAEEEKPRKLPIAVGEDGSAQAAPEEGLAAEPTTDPVGDVLID